jgi:DNA-binding response OmpR family regulator
MPDSRIHLGTGFLVVGEGADQRFLAEHLEAAGYRVASVTPAESVAVIASIRPFAVLVTPGIPEWQKTYLCTNIKARYPEVKIVVLRKRSGPVSVS